MHHTEAVRMACEGGHLCQCQAWASVVWYAFSEAAAIHEKAGQKHKEFAQGLTATDDRLKFSPRSVWPQRCTLPPFIPSCPLRPSMCLPGALSISDKLKLQSHLLQPLLTASLAMPPGPPFSSHLGTPKRGCLRCIHNCPSEVYKQSLFFRNIFHQVKKLVEKLKNLFGSRPEQMCSWRQPNVTFLSLEKPGSPVVLSCGWLQSHSGSFKVMLCPGSTPDWQILWEGPIIGSF